MTVTQADLERLIARATTHVVDPRHGLFGPDSITWKVNREAATMLGGGCASLMQLAHPYVAHAIHQHSPIDTDPQGRFARTFLHVFHVLFGDLDAALDTARRVHRIHTHIRGPITSPSARYPRGQRYEANDEGALRWVHATLVSTAVHCYTLLVGPLSDAERERYYAESLRFAALFGVDPDDMPRDWAAFERYLARMLSTETLEVTPEARAIEHRLLESHALAYRPAMAAMRAFTAGLLPASLRDAYELPFGATQQASFGLSVRLIRSTVASLPPSLRYFPAYVDALRRLEGKGPAPLSKLIENIALRSLPIAS